MAKFPEANKRLFKNIFVCRKCKAKIRTDPAKVMKGAARCRKCSGSALRPKRKK